MLKMLFSNAKKKIKEWKAPSLEEQFENYVGKIQFENTTKVLKKLKLYVQRIELDRGNIITSREAKLLAVDFFNNLKDAHLLDELCNLKKGVNEAIEDAINGKL